MLRYSARLTATTLTGTTVNGTTVQQAGATLIPPGVVVPYAGSSAPTGWLICDGSSQLRASFAALFTAIGTTYGNVDGTHFNLPDLGGRVPAGKEAVASRLTSAPGGCGWGNPWSCMAAARVLPSIHRNLPSHSHGVNRHRPLAYRSTRPANSCSLTVPAVKLWPSRSYWTNQRLNKHEF